MRRISASFQLYHFSSKGAEICGQVDVEHITTDKTRNERDSSQVVKLKDVIRRDTGRE